MFRSSILHMYTTAFAIARATVLQELGYLVIGRPVDCRLDPVQP